VTLLTIAHPQLTQPIRMTSNTQSITSRGNTFMPFWFEVALPDQLSNEIPRITLALDAVDQSIIQALRAARGEPTVTIELVLASQPDTVEVSAQDLPMRAFSFTATSVECELAPPDALNVRYPAHSYTRSHFTALG